MAVSESIVHEFFELHGFFVRQQRKSIVPARAENEDIDFLMFNPKVKEEPKELAFILTPGEVDRIGKAIVVVRSHHTETLNPAFLKDDDRLDRFLTPASLKRAASDFGELPGTLRKILITPALPQSAESRNQLVAALRERGIDAVLTFTTMLQDLVNAVETNRNYQKSDLLQTLRILKNYEFFRDMQMDLFRPRRAARRVSGSKPRTKTETADS